MRSFCPGFKYQSSVRCLVPQRSGLSKPGRSPAAVRPRGPVAHGLVSASLSPCWASLPASAAASTRTWPGSTCCSTSPKRSNFSFQHFVPKALGIFGTSLPKKHPKLKKDLFVVWESHPPTFLTPFPTPPPQSEDFGRWTWGGGAISRNL